MNENQKQRAFDWACALVTGIIVGAMLTWGLNLASMDVDGVVNDHGGWPRCTDQIADEGGICWGEPE